MADSSEKGLASHGWQGVIHRYRKFLPVTDATPIVTLFEGNTPLVEAPRLSQAIGEGIRVFLKMEGLNPTGSFKDRGMTLAVSKACEEGSKAVMCASTGNTSASAAAYAARARMQCIVVLPYGAIAMGKLAQALMHGAKVIAVHGNFDDALNIVKEITSSEPITLVNSINPFRIEGQKTGAFEICDQLEAAPDYQCIPVGNAGNITAYWKGYKEYHAGGVIQSLPRMLGFQAAGAAPIVLGHAIPHPETFATAIRIGNPASWKSAVEAAQESDGTIDMVSDEEILAAYKLLSSTEGIFCEPASAASVAGLLKKAREGYFKKLLKEKGSLRIVCILTGHGLKDPDNAIRAAEKPMEVPANVEAVLEKIRVGEPVPELVGVDS